MRKHEYITLSHVSGFIKRFKNNLDQKVITFWVVHQKFILPEKSTFATAIRAAHVSQQNILILFDNSGGRYPRITGVISQPRWAQVRAASLGEDYETIKTLYPSRTP